MRIKVTHSDTEKKAVTELSLPSPALLSEFGPGGDLGTPGRAVIQNLRARVRNTQPEAQISGWGSPMRRKRGHELGLFKIMGVSAHERICSGSPGRRM